MTYKKKTKKCKIYLLTNTINGKIYVGQTWTTFEERMGENGENYCNSPYIFNAIQKYGVENFHYTLLAECETKEDADKTEDEYMVKYDSLNSEIGYNLKRGGSHGEHSEKSKNKISETMKYLWTTMSDEEKNNRTKAFIEYSKFGERKPHTDEWKENNSKMMMERHKTDGHPMLGKHHTEEAKKAISEKQKGKIDTPETTLKKKAFQKTRQIPEETQQEIIKLYQDGISARKIQKITGINHIYRVLERNGIPLRANHNTFEGKSHSEETKSKMSEAATERWKKEQDIKQEQEIIELYQQDINVFKIQELTGCKNIYNILKKNNIVLRNK